jgi:c-di-GMP-binding flagellar brake protein YcgR
MAGDPFHGENTALTLRALKLRPGMFVQTLPLKGVQTPHEAQFCAALEGRGIMLVPLTNGDKFELKDGEMQTVRGFTGIYDFSFTSQVIQTFKHPFAYTLLAYPTEVRAKKVRNALRIRTSLPASILRNGDANSVVGTVVDLSVAGSMINSHDLLGAIGDHAALTFAIDFEQKKVDLHIQATVCHSNKCESGDGFRTGFSFKNLSRNDRMALQYFALAANETH